MERVRLRDRDDLQLPDDLLADVLRRLPPRHLAASRCVRRAWRRVIDERRLLRSDLLPLSLAGIFIQLDGHGCPEFLSRRPSSMAGATVNTKLQDFLPPTEYPFGEVPDADPFDNEDYFVRDHCNGLLLTYTYVVNPATQRWSYLSTPRRPLADLPRIVWYYNDYLSFDPTVSLHYQVFSIPCLCFLRAAEDADPLVEESEWPPSTWILNVFSSRLSRWEERSFAREGESAGSVAEARPHYGWPKCGAAYWRQALYVHCQANFLVRIDLSDDKYRVIKPPMNMDTKTHLGRSKHGVYYASLNVNKKAIVGENSEWNSDDDFNDNQDLTPTPSYTDSEGKTSGWRHWWDRVATPSSDGSPPPDNEGDWEANEEEEEEAEEAVAARARTKAETDAKAKVKATRDTQVPPTRRTTPALRKR
ncbi:hypothetical protein QYE76_063984 [Lolium multiflorum]|uniref:F-box domain-containing protein n=1 Tax=Lolium multiflorum TaxID=4521 RepID=A0AAD8S6N3_LOLMU|nr:hypothetical protein QYE76_063984 [Lolium multiflorum]